MPINISTCSGIFRWRPAAWLRVTGEDAANFLQGQFSNDLRGLSSRGAVYGLWLNLKGKVLADSFVLRGEGAGEFWLGSYFSPAAVIRERLESHVIADDVVIEDQTAEWSAISVIGDGAETGLEGHRPANCFVFRGRRNAGKCAEWIFRVDAGLPSELKGIVDHASDLTADDITRLRLSAGIPAIGVDVGSGDLPNEAGLEVDAVSYTKGCYLGQEVMARLKSMGQVRRRLQRVQGTGPQVPAVPVPVFIGARQVGELRSVVADGSGGWIGLAMVSLLHLVAGGNLSLAIDGPANVTLVEA